MVPEEKHPWAPAQGGYGDVMFPGHQNKVLESLGIFQDRLDAVVCNSNVDIEMCNTMFYTKLDELLSRLLC